MLCIMLCEMLCYETPNVPGVNRKLLLVVINVHVSYILLRHNATSLQVNITNVAYL